MSGYAQGPWRVATKGWYPGFRVWDANSLRVCHVDNPHYSQEQNEATARLVAAAPELLEACKSLAEDFDISSDSDDEYVDAVARILKVIEKAEVRP